MHEHPTRPIQWRAVRQRIRAPDCSGVLWIRCLQVKTLRLLQYFPAPEDASLRRTLNAILKKIITGERQRQLKTHTSIRQLVQALLLLRQLRSVAVQKPYTSENSLRMVRSSICRKPSRGPRVCFPDH